MITIYRGDDEPIAVTLRKNGNPFVISPTATVRAALVQDATVTGPVTCLATDLGADWTQSVVSIKFPSVVSEVAPIGRNKLEIEVVDNGTTTTFVVPHVAIVEDSI